MMAPEDEQQMACCVSPRPSPHGHPVLPGENDSLPQRPRADVDFLDVEQAHCRACDDGTREQLPRTTCTDARQLCALLGGEPRELVHQAFGVVRAEDSSDI